MIEPNIKKMGQNKIPHMSHAPNDHRLNERLMDEKNNFNYDATG